MHFLTQVPVNFINNVVPPWSDVIVFCATTLGVVLALSCIAFLAFRKFSYHDAFSGPEELFKKMGDIFILLFTSFGAYVFSVIFKNIFMVGRPATYNIDLHPLLQLSGYGFPSSHAAFFSAMAFTLFFIDKKAGAFAFVTALTICICRVLAGVHSPLDIIGGFVLGLLFSSLVDFVVEKLTNWKTA